MNPDLAYYVIKYYPHLMSDAEHRANLHLIYVTKATLGRDDPAAQAEVFGDQRHDRWVTDDPEVLQLASGGMREFRARTAARILADHDEKVFLNRCPRCRELARTPKAQQCPSCRFDWHPTKSDHA